MTSREVFAASTNAPAGVSGNDRDALLQVGSRRVFIVADGAQGRQGGEAADIAVAYVKQHADKLAAAFSGAACEDALQAIDREIHRNGSGGLTTAVLIVVDADGLIGASVGDSEAYIVRSADVVDLTESQARRPFLGSGAARPIGFGPHPLDGRLLVGTDGLFKYGKASVREQIARTAPIREIPWRLVDSVRLPGGSLQDDVTVYALEQSEATT